MKSFRILLREIFSSFSNKKWRIKKNLPFTLSRTAISIPPLFHVTASIETFFDSLLLKIIETSLSLSFPIPRLWDLASPFRISNPGERLNRHKRIISRRCLSGSRMAAAGWTRGRGEARRLHGRTDSTVSSLHAGRGRDVKLHVAGVFAIYVGALAKQQGVPCVHGWPSAHNRWHLRWLVIRTRAPTHPQLERLLKLAGFSPRAGYIERHFQLRFDATVFIRGD